MRCQSAKQQLLGGSPNLALLLRTGCGITHVVVSLVLATVAVVSFTVYPTPWATNVDYLFNMPDSIACCSPDPVLMRCDIDMDAALKDKR
jgi:hypothetical protein